jgi:hypothetical protein
MLVVVFFFNQNIILDSQRLPVLVAAPNDHGNAKPAKDIHLCMTFFAGRRM